MESNAVRLNFKFTLSPVAPAMATLRNITGLTQPQLAEYIGCKKQTVWRAEKGLSTQLVASAAIPALGIQGDSAAVQALIQHINAGGRMRIVSAEIELEPISDARDQDA